MYPESSSLLDIMIVLIVHTCWLNSLFRTLFVPKQIFLTSYISHTINFYLCYDTHTHTHAYASSVQWRGCCRTVNHWKAERGAESSVTQDKTCSDSPRTSFRPSSLSSSSTSSRKHRLLHRERRQFHSHINHLKRSGPNMNRRKIYCFQLGMTESKLYSVSAGFRSICLTRC